VGGGAAREAYGLVDYANAVFWLKPHPELGLSVLGSHDFGGDNAL